MARGAPDWFEKDWSYINTFQVLVAGSADSYFHGNTDIPVATRAMCVIGYNNLIYMIGGDTAGGEVATNRSYNPATDAYANLTACPVTISRIDIVELNGLFYFCGGYQGGAASNVLRIYNPATDNWSTGANLPDTRWRNRCVTDGTYIYSTGGNGGAGLNGELFRYDPVGDVWITLTSIPYAPACHGAVADSTNIWIYGGLLFAGESDLAYKYIIATDTWEQMPNLPDTYAYFTAVYKDGFGFSWCGDYSGPDTDDLYIYDTRSGHLDIIPGPGAAANQVATALLGSNVYALGGWTGAAELDQNIVLIADNIASSISYNEPEERRITFQSDTAARLTITKEGDDIYSEVITDHIFVLEANVNYNFSVSFMGSTWVNLYAEYNLRKEQEWI